MQNTYSKDGKTIRNIFVNPVKHFNGFLKDLSSVVCLNTKAFPINSERIVRGIIVIRTEEGFSWEYSMIGCIKTPIDIENIKMELSMPWEVETSNGESIELCGSISTSNTGQQKGRLWLKESTIGDVNETDEDNGYDY